MNERNRVVIIGGGFGGLWAAKALANKPVEVALIDRKNHHVFQPLLYQVATAVLSPGEIASPIRRILHHAKNIEVILGEAVDFDKENNAVRLDDGTEVPFDYLIVAAGAGTPISAVMNGRPGLRALRRLRTVEIRRRVLLAFELAERKAALSGVQDELTFAVVGAGPTGVELAGAIAGIARQALNKDFKAIDTSKARVVLFEGSDRVLGTFASDLSESAKQQLEELGVEVRLNSFVTEIEPGKLKVGEEWFECDVVLWATGVAASPLGSRLGVETDRAGRVKVEPDLSIAGHPNIFVIGDMVHLLQRTASLFPASVRRNADGLGDLRNILAEIKADREELRLRR